MRRKDEGLELNQTATTLPIFIETYNHSVPQGFPMASTKILRKFQDAHPLLFKRGDEWSIDRHRKRLMDWLFSNQDNA